MAPIASFHPCYLRAAVDAGTFGRNNSAADSAIFSVKMRSPSCAMPPREYVLGPSSLAVVCSGLAPNPTDDKQNSMFLKSISYMTIGPENLLRLISQSAGRRFDPVEWLYVFSHLHASSVSSVSSFRIFGSKSDSPAVIEKQQVGAISDRGGGLLIR
jgi:hypothetical protein